MSSPGEPSKITGSVLWPRKTLTRKTPLRTKKGLRARIRKIAKEKTRVTWNKNGKLLKRKPLKKVSKSRRRKLTEYFSLQREFLKRHRGCVICAAKGEVPRAATEVHHYAGRVGRLLTYVPYFVPSCRGCREWPHENASLARTLGVLAPTEEWNVYPQFDS